MKHIPLVLAAMLCAGPVLAQDTSPGENVGVSAQSVGEIELAKEFDTTGTRKFRMRTITVEPNGAIAMHSHAERPAIEYVLSGTATEYRGDQQIAHKSGDVVVTDHTVEHWWRNTGTEPLVLLATDIYVP